LAQLTGALSERVLQAELSSHLNAEKEVLPSSKNRSNGSTPKILKTDFGPVEISNPRDREATFEPQFIPKRQTRLPGLEEKVLYLYSHGNTTRQIQDCLQELYHTEISPTLVSQITEAVEEELLLWRKKPLQKQYAVIWIDATFVKVRENNSVQNKAIYLAIGMRFDGKKEILGIYSDGTEGAKYWMQVLSDFRNRGVEDILFVCCDGLKGLPESIQAVFPKSVTQLCIVHQIRNSLLQTSSQNKKEIASQLKDIYTASNEKIAKELLLKFEARWKNKYPRIAESWLSNWSNLSEFLKYSPEIRKMIYTTNSIESLNSQVKKVVKIKGHFPSQSSADKMIYLTIINIEKSWEKVTYPYWAQILAQLAIMFGDRVPQIRA
jgi:putative transposase